MNKNACVEPRVKATLDHGNTVFTDYFVLLKVDDEWKIANKVYNARKK